MELIIVGEAGLLKFTISNFCPTLFAMYKRSTSESNETISAEFEPAKPLEKEVSNVRFNSFVGDGAM